MYLREHKKPWPKSARRLAAFIWIVNIIVGLHVLVNL